MGDVIIDPRYLDIQTAPDGAPLQYCLPRTNRCGAELPVFEDYISPIPRTQWDAYLDEVSLEILTEKVKNQLREGTCASNANLGGFEVCWNMTFGKEFWVELSPISVYRWIAPGPQSGSVIGDNLTQMRNVGALPVDNAKNRELLAKLGLDSGHVLKETGYYQDFPSGWQETAKHFRIDEAYDIRSFDGLVTALLRKFVVVYGRAGHAIFAVRLVKRNGTYYLKYTNSWGNWGEKGDNGLQGYGYDSESFVARSIPSYGAYAIRAPRITETIFKWVMESMR